MLSFAQTDSVWIEGRVTDANTCQPVPVCEVQFLQNNEIMAVAFCNEQGYYTAGWVPMGACTLTVYYGGKSLYYAELQLEESAMLNIALVPDTASFRPLKPVVVTETKHFLGSRLITSPDDPRLWNFNNNPILYDVGSASSQFGLKGNPHATALSRERPAWLDAPFPKQEQTGKEQQKNAEK